MGYDFAYVSKPGNSSSEDSYFRLNIFGMAQYADAMLSLGMAYNSSSNEGGPWPTAPNDRIEEIAMGIRDGDARAYLADAIDDEIDQARQYEKELQAKLVHHPSGGETIPAHKFSTNDGWILTPDEISAALSTYDACPEERRDRVLTAVFAGDTYRRDYWDSWITYLRNAVDHGGIYVD